VLLVVRISSLFWVCWCLPPLTLAARALLVVSARVRLGAGPGIVRSSCGFKLD